MTSALLDPLPIQPFARPVQGGAILPGSKSLTNRVLLLATLCDEPVKLTDALFSEDTHIMIEALRKLGFAIKENVAEKIIDVEGRRGEIPTKKAKLHVGLAGTAARFLTALCAAAKEGIYEIDGTTQMRKRPMRGLIEVLRALGADIRCLKEEGFFPLEIHACGLRGGTVTLDASESSQMLSALLMVAPLARDDITINLSDSVRWPFVQMTARLMEEFGQPRFGPPSASSVSAHAGKPYRLVGRARQLYSIESDATAASYFLALPLVAGGSVDLPLLNLRSDALQGDAKFANVLEKIGLTLSDLERVFGIRASTANNISLKGITQDFSEFSDTFLTLAAIAPLLEGPTRITGIAHTRKQETDRVAGAARELKKLGQDVVEEHDSLTITPRPLKSGVEIETYGDHRFAMSFGILGCHNLHGDGRPWLTIKNPACCAKTFPNFFELLESLRKNSLEP